jgi:hypothetical protein
MFSATQLASPQWGSLGNPNCAAGEKYTDSELFGFHVEDPGPGAQAD